MASSKSPTGHEPTGHSADRLRSAAGQANTPKHYLKDRGAGKADRLADRLGADIAHADSL